VMPDQSKLGASASTPIADDTCRFVDEYFFFIIYKGICPGCIA
jgi:hypothetical protein